MLIWAPRSGSLDLSMPTKPVAAGPPAANGVAELPTNPPLGPSGCSFPCHRMAHADAAFTVVQSPCRSLLLHDVGIDAPCCNVTVYGREQSTGRKADRMGGPLLPPLTANAGAAMLGVGGLAQSTAAGPAFEGAHIRFGIGGVTGAVNTISLSDRGPVITTIGDAAPVGICGSGIVDALAMLLEAGAVDETGRLLDAKEYAETGDPRLLAAITSFDGESAVLLTGTDGEEDALYLPHIFLR